ncbi:FAD-dependent oxidoreductase [Epilithonimonas sp.]|uniref:FAD-dependent oxidoreductase n=1 Tax=Epilithonimonas sp. TaxID=2894511 RepID=UPI0035ADDBCD
MNRDGVRKSIWQEEIKSFPPAFNFETEYDVAIIGGGITGISTAYELQKRGKKCVVIEASNIGFGTTGGTTAHINNFLDTTYSEAIKKYGLEDAKLLFQSANEAIGIIEKNISDNHIDCDYEKKTGQLFALDDQQARQLDDMVEGAEKVGCKMLPASDISYPFPFVKAVEIPGQAQFHPIKYITALCQSFLNAGGTIVENCFCKNHSEENEWVVISTSRGIIRAKKLVYATHIPPGISMLHFTNAPYRSYAIAFTLKDLNYPLEPGYDLMDPYHYYRVQEVNGEILLIAGGEDHKTGHSDDTGVCFTNLENYVRQYFDVDVVKYSWSSQYYEPADGLPYIGKMSGSSSVFTATGFRGNGMIFGTLASKIISELILTGNSKYARLFSPSRITPIAGFTEFVKENITVATDFIKDKLFMEKISSLTEIAEGEGKVVKYEGDSYAIYKEKGGRLHLLKSTCPHAKCEVRWNSAEISWDCPCHGSRFSVNGKVLNTPSVTDLIKIREKDIE